MDRLFYVCICWLFSFFQVQAQQPVFQGGRKALDRFVSSNLIYPLFSRNNCIQARVEVSFRLDKSGNVTTAHISRGPGIDLDEEALRLVKLSSGKWEVPADFNTANNLIFPVVFSMNDPTCQNLRSEDIRKAIKNYRNQQSLMLAISNYYKQMSGTPGENDDARILSLKQELGIDDAYFDAVIEQAMSKIKQGDTPSACKDLQSIKELGSRKAEELLRQYCH